MVLTGRAAFSAGITHAAQWKLSAGATIIGEPVGDALDMWSEGGNLMLPTRGSPFTTRTHFTPTRREDYPEFRPYFADLNVSSLKPDVLVEPSWEDYLAGRDPVFEAALVRTRRVNR